MIDIINFSCKFFDDFLDVFKSKLDASGTKF